MPALPPRTRHAIERLFPPAQRDEVARLIAEECGNNLPLCHDWKPESIERIQLAVLKLSEGQTGKLLDWITQAQRDWRDVLVAAGFANSLEIHKTWADTLR